jgi:nucleoid-associated protein YgaU
MINEQNYYAGKDPYGKAYVVQFDDGDIALEKNIPVISISDCDKVHTVMDGETLHSIAFRYYGDSGYWYQIAEANKIINPFSEAEFYVGRRLIIPLYGISE